jgi:amidase
MSEPSDLSAIFVRKMDLGGDGLRVGVKDSIDIAGFPTRMGSACLRDAPAAQRHADVVQSLLSAGCRIVGKTNMHELAYGVTGINHWSGTPVNPRAPGRIPGGSSTGSAVAVAAELVDFAVGTDTGGSIRIPATCCGIYGLKPSYGRVSRLGVHPARSTLDCVGPFARDLAMIERAMVAIDGSFHPQSAPARATVGWVEVEASADVITAARAALSQAAVAVRPVALPTLTSAHWAGLAVLSSENWVAFGPLAGCDALGADVRQRLLAAREVSAAEVAAAEDVRRAFQAEVNGVLGDVDALALPTLPGVPPLLAAVGDYRAAVRISPLVRPFNLSGHPALSIPISTAEGLPAGLQLIGRAQEDEALCALGRRIAGAFAVAAGARA